MRTVLAPLLVVALAGGFGLGWWARDLGESEAPARSPSPSGRGGARSGGELRPPDVGLDSLSEPLTASRPQFGHYDAGDLPDPEEATAPAGEVPEKNPVAEAMKGFLPIVKLQMKTQSKGVAAEIADAMNLDPAQAKLLAAALGDEANRQVDAAWEMLFGEGEIDPEALGVLYGMFGVTMSPELEETLTSFMDDGQIGAFRDELGRQRERQVDQAVEMQIRMTGVSDLTEDQRRRVRDVYRDANVLQQQTEYFVRYLRDPKRLREVLDNPDQLAADLERGFTPQRTKLRDILTPEQFQKYRKSEQNMIELARAQLRMFAPQPAAKPAGDAPEK